jgi:DNA-binding response OmpR family regulator
MPPGTRILVIDDNIDLTKIIYLLLTAEGFSTRVCNDLEEGLFCLQEWKPQVLLLDVNINGEDARIFCRKIKEDKKEEIIIILMSGDESTLEYNEGYGADDFMAKPFDSNILIQKISSFLTQKA